MRFLAIAVLAASLWDCLESDACLRHSDCDGDQQCIDGRCAAETAPGGSGGTGGGTAGAAGSGGG